MANLAGSATDDGLPNPPGTLTYTWSAVSGPGTVTFGNASALSTTASFSVPGTYVLQLTASDSALDSTDTVTITVTARVTISGYVTLGDGTPIPGVTMNGLPQAPLTDTNGYYTDTVTYGWSGMVTPGLGTRSFSPGSRDYTYVTADQTTQDYVLNATTLYVDDDATNDPGPGDPTVSDQAADGSTVHPFDAIQKAINAAISGDTVMVLPGTYTGTGNQDIDFGGKAITVQGTSPGDPSVVAATVIDCQGSAAANHRGFHFHVGEIASSVLAGLTITNAYISGGLGNDGGGIFCEYASPTIRNCTIRNCRAGVGGGISSLGSTPSIVRCTVSNNSADYGGGIRCDSATVISNCVIRNNTAVGQGGGIYYYINVTIRDCVIVSNGASMGGGIQAENEPGTFGTITNCTICDNTGGGGIASDYNPALTVVSNCIVWRNTGGSVSAGTVFYSDVGGGYPGGTNLNVDPMMTSDYHLQPGSPCIDAGDPAFTPAPGGDRHGWPAPAHRQPHRHRRG